MPLVKAVCTNCGANLEVDNSKDAAICPMCGTPYIVEKAIQRYNTINTSIDANTINEAGFKKLLDAANGFLKLGDYSSASHKFSQITQEYPQAFEGWYGLVCSSIEMNHVYDQMAADNARKLASAEQEAKLNEVVASAKMRGLNNLTNHFSTLKNMAQYCIKNKCGFDTERRFGVLPNEVRLCLISGQDGKMYCRLGGMSSDWDGRYTGEYTYYLLNNVNSNNGSVIFDPQGARISLKYKIVQKYKPSGLFSSSKPAKYQAVVNQDTSPCGIKLTFVNCRLTNDQYEFIVDYVDKNGICHKGIILRQYLFKTMEEECLWIKSQV